MLGIGGPRCKQYLWQEMCLVNIIAASANVRYGTYGNIPKKDT